MKKPKRKFTIEVTQLDHIKWVASTTIDGVIIESGTPDFGAMPAVSSLINAIDRAASDGKIDRKLSHYLSDRPDKPQPTQHFPKRLQQ